MRERTYIAIDLKSFYASVECVERGLDPLHTNLVVADTSRTDKTICLAVSPSLKSFGVPSRPRLFEVIQKVKFINTKRLQKAPFHRFTGKSICDEDLSLELSYIAATPRMSLYIQYSTRIYEVYLKFISEKDIHVYSIDEVFIDATEYLKYYNLDAHALARKIIQEILNTTGITATAGIGTNLYLAKVAMDIVAKHIPADKDGVRIAELNEITYREHLWEHRPLTDFWRIGRGYAKKLENMGLYTMGDIALYSLNNENALFKMFGVNAELLIDHAWGKEPCLIEDIKKYKPDKNSISIGQVLPKPYLYESAKIVIKEMAEELALTLFAKNVVTKQVSLGVGYDYSDNLDYTDAINKMDYINNHGAVELSKYTNSVTDITSAITKIFEKIGDPLLSIRRIHVCAYDVLSSSQASTKVIQTSLFEDIEENVKVDKREQKAQEAILKIKNKYGKNALFKARDKMSDSTQLERNKQIGGHKA
jgi:DNA polymerase V